MLESVQSNGSVALVIDDSPMVRDFVSEILTRAGYKVVEADNGLDGVRLSQRLRPEVVVSDVFMPGQDGLYVMRELKRLKHDARLVVISGRSRLMKEYDVLEVAKKLGADATLTKPFTPYELIQAVTDLPVLN